MAILLLLCGAFLVGEYYNGKSKIIIQRQLTGSNNIEKTWNFYIAEGFSKEATAGILGNYMRESKMDPTIEEKGNNIGFGLAQWSFSRRTDLEKWTKENDFLPSSLEGQLNFSLIEMEKMKFGKYKYNDFKRVNNVKEATILFEKYYERAGVVALEERVKNAEEIYKKYS